MVPTDLDFAALNKLLSLTQQEKESPGLIVINRDDAEREFGIDTAKLPGVGGLVAVTEHEIRLCEPGELP